MFKLWQPRFIGHVYMAVKEWLDTHPQERGSAFWYEMVYIKEEANRAIKERCSSEVARP